jgi:hypothetical protein
MSLITETEQLSRLSQLLQSIIDIVPTWVEGQLGFATIADLVVDQDLTAGLANGRFVRIMDHGGFDLIRVASGVVHYTAASGAQFRVRMDRVSPLYFGAVGDGATNDAAALDLADTSDAVEIDLRGLSYRYDGTWAPTKPVWNGSVINNDGVVDYGLLTETRVATEAEAAATLTPASQAKLATLQAVSDIVSAALSGTSQTVQGRLVAIDENSGSLVANTWTRRNFNFLETNTVSGGQLVNNQIILPAGRYQLRASSQLVAEGAACRIRLRDVVNNNTLAESIDHASWPFSLVTPTVHVDVVLSAATTIEVQYLAEKARANDGLGLRKAATPARFAMFEATKIG